PGLAVPGGRGAQPPGAGPARAEHPGQHDPRLGEMGRPGLRRRRAADLRREDGDRTSQPGHLRRGRRDRRPVGAGRAEPGRGRRRYRRGVPVTGVLGARRLILPAAAVAAILLGAGLAFALTGPSASRSPAATATAPASPAGTAGQGQPLVPRVSLASVRWSGFYGVELPVSAQAGPYNSSGGVAVGFAHTPLGALLAAVNI